MTISASVSPASAEAVPAGSTQVYRGEVRARWVDAARGMIIVLVVFGHTVNGLLSARLLASGGFWPQLFPLLHTFRMPTFFFLAGLFIERRLAKGRGGYLKTIVQRIGWPYLFWSIVTLIVIGLAGDLVNTPYPLDPLRWIAVLWDPTSQFWFLQTLFILHVCSYILHPRLGSKLLFIAALFIMQIPMLGHVGIALDAVCTYAPFYAAGVLLGPAVMASPLRPDRALLILVVAALVWLGCVYAGGYLGPSPGGGTDAGATIPAAIAGSLACIAFAQTSPVANNRLLLYLGRHSMSIFVLHVFFIVGVRMVASKVLGIDDAWTILALSLVAGLWGPLLMLSLATRMQVAGKLGLS